VRPGGPLPDAPLIVVSDAGPQYVRSALTAVEDPMAPKAEGVKEVKGTSSLPPGMFVDAVIRGTEGNLGVGKGSNGVGRAGWLISDPDHTNASTT